LVSHIKGSRRLWEFENRVERIIGLKREFYNTTLTHMTEVWALRRNNKKYVQMELLRNVSRYTS
jgi:hypothetical protein